MCIFILELYFYLVRVLSIALHTSNICTYLQTYNTYAHISDTIDTCISIHICKYVYLNLS